MKVRPRLSGSFAEMLFEGYNKVYLKNQNEVSVFTGPLHFVGNKSSVVELAAKFEVHPIMVGEQKQELSGNAAEMFDKSRKTKKQRKNITEPELSFQ